MSRGPACELAGRILLTGAWGMPTCLAGSLSDNGLFWGDTAGKVYELATLPSLPAMQLNWEAGNSAVRAVHCEHTDWVTQACHAPPLAVPENTQHSLCST